MQEVTEFVNKNSKAKIASGVIMNPHMSYDNYRYFFIEGFT